MLQDILTLDSYSPNHRVSLDGLEVTGEYNTAHGQFLLNHVMKEGTTFNLTISGMGVVKINTFDSFEKAIEWIQFGKAMPNPCQRIRGRLNLSATFCARVKANSMEFLPYEQGHANIPGNIFNLTVGGPSTVLAFDIECGDVKVLVTNVLERGCPIDQVFYPLHAPQINLNRVVMGCQARLSAPARYSLVKIIGNVFTQDTVMILNVDGPAKTRHTGSYFRLWVMRENSNGDEGVSDKPYDYKGSIMFPVNPKALETYMVVVTDNHLRITHGSDSSVNDVINEEFAKCDPCSLSLWVEFYRITFSVHKTGLKWNWSIDQYESGSSSGRSGLLPVPPTCDTNNNKRIRGRTESNSSSNSSSNGNSLDLLDTSSLLDAGGPITPPVTNCGHAHVSNPPSQSYTSRSDSQPNIHMSPNATSDNNDHFRPLEHIRDLDPITQSGLQQYDVIRESQVSLETDSYLSVLSNIEDSHTTVQRHPGQDGNAWSLPTSAPIPCRGTKQKHKSEKSCKSTSLKGIAKKIKNLSVKSACAPVSSSRDNGTQHTHGVQRATGGEVSEFSNGGFFDNDDNWGLDRSGNHAISSRLGSINSISSPMNVGSLHTAPLCPGSHSSSNSSSSSNPFSTFKPEPVNLVTSEVNGNRAMMRRRGSSILSVDLLDVSPSSVAGMSPQGHNSTTSSTRTSGDQFPTIIPGHNAIFSGFQSAQLVNSFQELCFNNNNNSNSNNDNNNDDVSDNNNINNDDRSISNMNETDNNDLPGHRASVRTVDSGYNEFGFLALPYSDLNLERQHPRTKYARSSLSSYRSDESHHQTIPKRLD